MSFRLCKALVLFTLAAPACVFLAGMIFFVFGVRDDSVYDVVRASIITFTAFVILNILLSIALVVVFLARRISTRSHPVQDNEQS